MTADRCLTRLPAFLLVVLFAAKVITLVGHDVPLSWWSPIAFFWHDAAVVIVFAATSVLVSVVITAAAPAAARSTSPAGARPTASAASVAVIYVAVAAYSAVNVAVTRVLSTPLTWPMWRAASGTLSDSILVYATWDNVALTLLIPALAIGLPFVFVSPTHARDARPPGARGAGLFATILVAVVALGPLAASRVDTRGFERNAWTALITTMPLARERTWFGQERAWLAAERISSGRERPWPPSGFAADRNIVMISLESAGAQYLGVYGAAPDVMPSLTALARHAVVFDHAYAAYPESIKGLFSILCSAYPVFGSSAELYADAPCESIATLLRRRGYRTALFHSGRFAYLGMESIVRDRGYDVLEDAGDIGGKRESSFGVDEPSTVTRMLRWIDTLGPGDRFFLTYLPIAGHHPYDTPEPGPFPEREMIDRYRNALAYGDAALGSLMTGLQARGLENETLWIVFGDHGEAFGQHDGNFGHTFQVFDENVHVPFIVSAPGLIARQVRNRSVVSLIDTAPTILDAIGAASPSIYQGRSMFDGAPRAAFFFTDYSLGLLGLRDGRFKTIYELDSGRVRLFDLEIDPGETTDIAREQPERTARFVRRVTSLR